MKEIQYTVKCNMCEWYGNEEDLLFVQDDDDCFDACPHCETDGFLINLDDLVDDE